LRGAEHPLARLSTQDVRNVRALYSDGEKQRVIAEKYGISQPAVSAIVNHKRWA
jgi:predicted transcriptional regulator